MEKKEKKQKPQMPAMSIEVKIGPNEYTIKYPNVGQRIDIERMKIKVTDGTSAQMLNGSTNMAYQAYLFTEAIATFSILLPQLRTDLNVNSLTELMPKDFKSINKAYEKYYDWMSKWTEFELFDEEEGVE